MTQFPDDVARVAELIKDRGSLEVVTRLVRAESVYHQSRLAQLKEMEEALADQAKKLG